jgi:hypothetical protein
MDNPGGVPDPRSFAPDYTLATLSRVREAQTIFGPQLHWQGHYCQFSWHKGTYCQLYWRKRTLHRPGSLVRNGLCARPVGADSRFRGYAGSDPGGQRPL